MYLVLIETSGNQNYIFSTNKLKENVGASELTYRAGTDWIIQAIAAVSGCPEWNNNNQSIREKLLSQKLNRPIESSSGDVKVEIIVATSGKALLLTKEPEDAKQIIRNITQKALNQSPGLDICGVISGDFDWNDKEALGKMNLQVHQRFEALRSERPSPELRFLRLPVVESCATSGLPANKVDPHTPDNTPVLRSLVSLKKREAVRSGFTRIERLLKNHPSGFNLARSIQVLDKDREVTSEDLPDSNNNDSRTSDSLDWLSVIHADGNGLGEIFLNFEEHLKNLEPKNSDSNRNYIDYLRKFSLALDYCTEQAFIKALNAFPPRSDKLLPIVPLVLGGDDLTVVCDGKFALRFTQLFLKHFEKETQKTGPEYYDGVVSKIAKEALKVGRLSACAGVAIIKPHFPFSIAYELAEALTQSAKQVKKIVQTKPEEDGAKKPYPCSALDFHIVYDASGVDLEQIRQKLHQEEGRTKLYSRPYVITPENELRTAAGLDWVKNHRWEDFEKRVKLLTASTEEGVRKLPNSQMHDLRTGLTLGRKLADARYCLIRDRYLKQGLVELAGSKDSLFNEEESNSNIYITGLLDAMDAASFLVVEDPVSQETPAPVAKPKP